MPQGFAHGDDARRVEPVGRFVQEQQARVAQQGGGDPEPLLHAKRVALDLVPGAIEQAHELEQLLDAAIGRVRSSCGEGAQVLAPRQVGIERWRLDQGTDLEQAAAVPSPERLAEHLDGARVGMDQAGQQPHRRRLAGPVRAEEPVDDPGRDRQVQSGQGDARAVALLEPSGGEGESVGIGHSSSDPSLAGEASADGRASRPCGRDPTGISRSPAAPTEPARAAADCQCVRVPGRSGGTSARSNWVPDRATARSRVIGRLGRAVSGGHGSSRRTRRPGHDSGSQRDRLALRPSGHLVAVESRQPDVEQDEVGAVLGRRPAGQPRRHRRRVRYPSASSMPSSNVRLAASSSTTRTSGPVPAGGCASVVRRVAIQRSSSRHWRPAPCRWATADPSPEATSSRASQPWRTAKVTAFVRLGTRACA